MWDVPHFIKGVLYVKVVVYRARGKDGFLYDISFNPFVDYEILKKTRNIERLEVITPEIPFEMGLKFLKGVYGYYSIIGKINTSREFLVSRAFRKLNIKRIQINITKGKDKLSLSDISRVEEYIRGRIVSFDKLLSLGEHIGIKDSDIIDAVQGLYCMRRIRLASKSGELKNSNPVCGFEESLLTSISDDRESIYLYEADNYSISKIAHGKIKQSKLSEISKKAELEFLNFIKSRKNNGILWCISNSFEYDLLFRGMMEVINRGGRILFITSRLSAFEAKETFKRSFEDIDIEITDGFIPNYRNLDISVCSYDEYLCFYKAFDLVIIDGRYSFIDGLDQKMYEVFHRTVKEKGKFLNITCCPERGKRGFLKETSYVIPLPVSHMKNPIPEPRIITSRYLKEESVFLPSMVIEVIRWSIKEGSRIILFVPDRDTLQKIYQYLINVEELDRDIINISTDEEKNSLFMFKRGEVKILISMDVRDAIQIIEDVNVIVMNSDEKIYRVDTLVNIASMAAYHTDNKIKEVIFVASTENENISLAKSIIRDINKTAWEMGYIKI